MTHLINNSGRLLHAAYQVPSPTPGGQPVGKYLQIDEDTPGIPPGSHDIDDATAALILDHKTNKIFFDSGMLDIKDGPAPKIEKTLDKGPKIFRADKAALAAHKAKAKAK